jgi:hypothetical protein
MRVKPAIPGAVIRDPHTKRLLSADGSDVPDNSFWTRRHLAGEVMRRVGDAWERRLPSGQVVLVPDGGGLLRVTDPAQPAGNEPIAPLTTRGTR